MFNGDMRKCVSPTLSNSEANGKIYIVNICFVLESLLT